MSRGSDLSAFEHIARALAPFLGANMAHAAVEVNRKKLGLTSEEIGPNDLHRLLDELSPGLRVFLGQLQTRRVIDRIRGELTSPRGDR